MQVLLKSKFFFLTLLDKLICLHTRYLWSYCVDYVSYVKPCSFSRMMYLVHATSNTHFQLVGACNVNFVLFH
jgi:hypothetical protein